MDAEQSEKLENVYIDKLAVVSESATIGDGTKIWAFVQVGDNAKIGKNCVISNGVYIDRNVIIGDNVKIQNKSSVADGVIIEKDCFIGPGVIFTNDKYPTVHKVRNLKGVNWKVMEGATIGANATILPDVNIGKRAMIGAGAVIIDSVPDEAVMFGNPARMVGKREDKD